MIMRPQVVIPLRLSSLSISRPVQPQFAGIKNVRVFLPLAISPAIAIKGLIQSKLIPSFQSSFATSSSPLLIRIEHLFFHYTTGAEGSATFDGVGRILAMK